MEEITKILADETLTAEQKAEKIKQINVEITNKAIQERIAREKEKQEKSKTELEQSKTELEKRLERLELQRKEEIKLRYQDKYGDKAEEALKRREKGYDETDIDLLFKPKTTELRDFEERKIEESKLNLTKEEKEKKKKLEEIIEKNEKWLNQWK